MYGGSGYDLANQDARLLPESMRIKVPARCALERAIVRVYVFRVPLNMEFLVEPAAYWVHRLNAL